MRVRSANIPAPPGNAATTGQGLVRGSRNTSDNIYATSKDRPAAAMLEGKPRIGRPGGPSLSDLHFPLLRSWQKPRFLPAETKLMSEKAPQATFSNELDGLNEGFGQRLIQIGN